MKRKSAAPSHPQIAIRGGDAPVLSGALTIDTLTKARDALRSKPKTLDIGGLDTLDSSGALFLCELHKKKQVELTNVRPEHESLLELVGRLELKTLPPVKKPPGWQRLFIELGRGAIHAWKDMIEIITFCGHAAVVTWYAVSHPRHLRLPSIARHVEETGIYALPIVALMAMMIAVVIGYQGVAQLRPYGEEDFTINLIAVSVLREMGVLITAILVAGRSGSAFTAEIGMMQSRQEVDALKVMGFEPMELLVVPRLIGLVIALPLLTFFADMMGLFGGAIISWTVLDLAPFQYIQRVHQAVSFSDFYIGLIKAPVMAFFIAVIGCMHGLRVSGSAESVGKETTEAVVKAIFFVLALDAVFSILFERLGI